MLTGKVIVKNDDMGGKVVALTIEQSHSRQDRVWGLLSMLGYRPVSGSRHGEIMVDE